MRSSLSDNLAGERPLIIELIRSMSRGTLTPKQSRQMQELEQRQVTTDDAFIIKKVEDWLKLPEGERPAGETLFGDLWYKGELCILFADTNAGKSILAVQIGEAISTGRQFGDMPVQQQAEPVLYFDFELNAAQFAARYTALNGHMYRFAPNFYRVVINPDATREGKFASYHDYLINSLENIIVTTGSRTIIIDNITALRSSTENAAGAVKLMRSLHHIKNTYRLSMLVLAHTPKRNPCRPITRDDLQGSKMLINFADSAFAIGESQVSPGLRYLKQVKQRSGDLTMGADAVKFCRISKQGGFLLFEFEGQGSEAPHLLPYTEQLRKGEAAQMVKLHAQGQSIRQIAKETGCTASKVFRVLKREGIVGA
ncbi:AAA family ATPase [Mucilaginibacter psychrotolerans]|uniref:LuxR family transcriptional regulator n=1 Tax=Mucilaginibacter psychrotolerans TaxID=1524096 RepID=A0A4Y8SMH2_9SPHI|nr:AAA family ATPase [Mucilaginibacter psychrotolerans]TFF39737.1 LuxR family transcriptional regulator [Mucilaginibacter psychrotolerans]